MIFQHMQNSLNYYEEESGDTQFRNQLAKKNPQTVIIQG